jgi:hypothetical protein
LGWELVDPQRNVDAFVAAMPGEEGLLRELMSTVTAPLES